MREGTPLGEPDTFLKAREVCEAEFILAAVPETERSEQPHLGRKRTAKTTTRTGGSDD